MKTIKFLADSTKLMIENGTPENISVGTFKIESSGSLHFWAGRTGTFDNYRLSFQIQFRPDHIQHLLDLGVEIDFNSVQMSGIKMTEFGLFVSGPLNIGSTWQREGFGSIIFDGTNESQVLSALEVIPR